MCKQRVAVKAEQNPERAGDVNQKQEHCDRQAAFSQDQRRQHDQKIQARTNALSLLEGSVLLRDGGIERDEHGANRREPDPDQQRADHQQRQVQG